MSKTLIIVESPTKAKTLSKMLGNAFTVLSSYGHLRDLPKSKLGVDVEKNFEPQYVVPKDSKKIVTELKKKSKNANAVILATDEDREGEAIAWHLKEVLELPSDKTKRITFHEITKSAITEALNHPREIDENLVNAQQARRVLDRLVGYKLSPFLWKKVLRGLSAGRVQSVAVRLIVEREKERQNFKAEEYWTIEATFQTKDEKTFTAALVRLNGKDLKKFDLASKEGVEKIVLSLPDEFTITDVTENKVIKKQLPPFTTSTLQQGANRAFGYSARQTMRLAQQLYEGIPLENGEETGLITYMRTDSVNLSKDFVDETRAFIPKEYGEKYLPKDPVKYFAKSKLAQEAHEAIRPTSVLRTPDSVSKFLEKNQLKLYTIIWQRAVSSQMPPAEMTEAKIILEDENKNHTFRASGQIVAFDGFLKVWPRAVEEKELPKVSGGENVRKTSVEQAQHFTEPPARFTDASLVKTLEEYDIGRPSTYAPTIATIIERGYIEREKRTLKPTDAAFLVTELLEKHFSNIVDYKFTAQMESELDKIAEGETAWQPVIKNFYDPFEKNLKEKESELTKREVTETATDETCPKCGKPLVIKFGRFGKFYACTGYPECRHTAPFEKEKREAKPLDENCPKCGNPLVEKQSRYGSFIGCSKYPECKYTANRNEKLNIKCPLCGDGEMVVKKTKRGKPFYACDQYPKCQFALWNKPINEACPECKSLLVYKGKNKIACSNASCKFTKESPEEIKEEKIEQ